MQTIHSMSLHCAIIHRISGPHSGAAVSTHGAAFGSAHSADRPAAGLAETLR